MPLKGVFVVLWLVISQHATANPTEPALPGASVQAAKNAMKAGHSARAVDLLRKALGHVRRPGSLDEISRLFEELGWFRDARIVSDRLSETPSADPVLRLLHAIRSKELASKEGDAFLRLPSDRTWSVRRVNGDRVPKGKRTVAIPTNQSSVVELASSDGRELWIARVDGLRARRIDLMLQPAVCLESRARRWRSVQLGDTAIQTPLAEIRRMHLPGGTHALEVTVDEGKPLSLVIDGTAGQCTAIDADLEAAARLRQARLSAEMSVRNQPGPYVATATGALLLGIGWTLLVLADGKRERPTTHDDADTLDRVGGVALGAGIAAGATGLVWYFINVARGRKAARAISAPPPAEGTND